MDETELPPFIKEMGRRLLYLLKEDATSLDAAIFINGCEEYGVEDEILAFTQEHPHASLSELLAYFDSIVPPIEYTDEEDEDEDEEDWDDDIDYEEYYRSHFRKGDSGIFYEDYYRSLIQNADSDAQ